MPFSKKSFFAPVSSSGPWIIRSDWITLRLPPSLIRMKTRPAPCSRPFTLSAKKTYFPLSMSRKLSGSSREMSNSTWAWDLIR